MTTSPTRARWLAAHPYLTPVADLEQVVRDAAAGAVPALPPPRLEPYASDYAAGVPLLRSERAGIDVVAVTAEAVGALLARLESAPLPDPVRAACLELRDVLSGPSRDAVIRYALDWGDETPAPPHAGVLRLLAWSALAPALAPTLRAFEVWRCDDNWRRAYCPTCGAAPSLAHLEAESDGRRRILSCACCATRWRYQRIGCPFCGNEAPAQLDCLEIGGEPGFRLDACGECGGYTKTWVGDGDGDASLFLSEWPTLHLDALAKERGFRRAGASLYDV